MSLLVELPQNEFNPLAFAQFSPVAGFNRGNALAMAWLSQLAYETHLPGKVADIAKLWSLMDLRIIQQPAKTTLPLSDTRGVIAIQQGALLIAFAGTDPLNLLNWVSDFYLGRPAADVHEGFLDAAAAVWTQVGAAIETCMKENRPLFIAGHSLGAAIALVTADRARREKGLNAAQVYVFGSPRVGRSDFVTGYNAAFGLTTYRLVHGKDIVATVPFSQLGFHHVGRFLSCGSGAKFDTTKLLDNFANDDPLGDDGFFDGLAVRLQNLFGFPSLTARADMLGALTSLLAPSIGDHLPDRYFRALTV